MFAAFFLIIQYLTQVHGDSAIRPASRRCRGRCCRSPSRRSPGALGGRIGSRPLIVAGLLLLSAGTAGAAFAMGVGASYAELVAPLVAIGVGIALVLPNVASAALGSALPEHIGKASGANSTFRQLGGVFGIAVAVLVFDRAGSYASPGRRRRRRARRAASSPRPSASSARSARSGSRAAAQAARRPAAARAGALPLAELEAAAAARGGRRSRRGRARCPAATKRATTRRRQP